jgi:hypothetical protein
VSNSIVNEKIDLSVPVIQVGGSAEIVRTIPADEFERAIETLF